jgi:hypothetical protein
MNHTGGSSQVNEKLQEVAEIEKLLFDSASGLGDTIAREINQYTVALISARAGQLSLAGTGTLISFLESPYILTAAHVWEEKLKTADEILIPLEENSRRRYSIKRDYLVSFGPTKPADWNEWGPDIALLRLPPELVGSIKAVGKPFFNLSTKWERSIAYAIEARFLMGAPALRGTFTARSAFPEMQAMLVWAKTGPFLSTGLPCNVRPDFDYVDLDIDTTQPDVASRFGGVSGGGLWRVYIYRTADGNTESFKVLDGVAFWEEPGGHGLIVRCHGPQSIGAALRCFYPA